MQHLRQVRLDDRDNAAVPELAQTLSVLEEGWSATPGTRSPIAPTRLPPISGGCWSSEWGRTRAP